MTRPAWLRAIWSEEPTGFCHGYTTGDGPDLRGDPAVHAHATAVDRVTAAVGLGAAAWARQVHGERVLYADRPGCLGEADALWTDVPGLGVLGRTADCPIVLVTGRRADGTRLCGMAHAGWRSTAAGIAARLVAALITGGLDATTATAGIAPSAGPCCYEVGDEVECALTAAAGVAAGEFMLRREGRLLFDLWRANTAALAGAGLASGSITVSGICSICSAEMPSHRRDGRGAGRSAVLVGLC